MKNLLFLLLLISGLSYGQFTATGYTGNAYNGDGVMRGGTYGTGIDWPNGSPLWGEVTIKYQGTPYVKTEYKMGTVTTQGKSDFKAPMRYNAQQNKIEFLGEDDKQRELLRRPYITANFDGKIYSILNYMEKGEEKLGYFNPLNTEGKTRILLMPKKTMITGSKRLYNGYEQVTPVKFEDVSSYYIKKDRGPAEPIKLNKKSILKSLQDKAPELEAFISEHHLNLKKEVDAIRLVDYYNSLTAKPASKKHAES